MKKGKYETKKTLYGDAKKELRMGTLLIVTHLNLVLVEAFPKVFLFNL